MCGKHEISSYGKDTTTHSVWMLVYQQLFLVVITLELSHFLEFILPSPREQLTKKINVYFSSVLEFYLWPHPGPCHRREHNKTRFICVLVYVNPLHILNHLSVQLYLQTYNAMHGHKAKVCTGKSGGFSPGTPVFA